MTEQLYSAEEAAQILGLQVRTVRGYLRDGRLPGVRIGKQYRIARVDLEAFTGGGSASAPPSLAAVSASAQGPRVEVSAVVQVDDVDPESAARIERTLEAAIAGRSADEAPLRLEPLYDQDRRRLKAVIVGSPADSAELIRVIELVARAGN